ncbi:ABC transporter substrate-binding protein [Accumulibacter sp.]|uniref:ABC transporter substrate-binding protein n=1 Tax=Accumulibacter sp. TaxID=2053492 RepID=UPI0025E85379|nr:ABC transporter substrate-binding protein [Accumulibacter sp.]MCM8594815.1 ABC transporter substrate-binding protein [Accumulibacter sp.]MCM8627125.1 ABC transporter substrate-binding protein [Accumulibacter sp.]MDS4048960.1 ABC transporter substrate-binding protein [Accumulibacter sp.]
MPSGSLAAPLLSRLLALLLILLLAGCGHEWNDPYPAAERGRNILYAGFSERPKHLDPVQSYTEDEITFTGQVYEPPLQYHYLKRPYTLIPLTSEAVPVPRYFDEQGRELPAAAPAAAIARSVYQVRIRPGIRYQPHPALATDDAGEPAYAHLDEQALRGIDGIADFPRTGTRELVADDYIYEIKRLAHPRLHSPIFSLMAERIVGLRELGAALHEEAKRLPPGAWLDLDRFVLSGVERVDRYTYRITIRGKYPQFVYWLAMPFFAPIPREVDRFFNQPGMAAKNLTLDWYPVGTGPYMLTQNNPNSRMVLERNPNFHGERYPCHGEPGDEEAGLLADCGKPLPFIDQAIYSREKESIPYWNKFLQGYYDASGISSDSFDQAVRLGVGGDIQLSDEMRERGIRLLTSVRMSIFYMGFNMLDPVVGGLAEQSTKLRQALSIAIDQEEFISIFMNGRGIPATSPLPPGIFGHLEGEAGNNPVVYDWLDGRAQRKTISEARKLLADAGWPNGRHVRTGEPLVLYLDTTSGGMGEKSRLDWLTRQFARLDIQLVVRSTDFNRFQEKVRKGAVQLYYLGWNADYPDPENFLFLLAGSEGKVARSGENASNYANPEFDRLFEQMKNMDSEGQRAVDRLAVIRQAVAVLQHDAPWIFGFHPTSYTLSHVWLRNRKPAEVGHNTLKYQRIDVAERERLRAQWNRPVVWPLAVVGLLLIAVVVPAALAYRRRERSRAA